MKFLITGANGQLGNELCRILKNGESEIGAIPKECIDAEIIAVDVDKLDITDVDAVNSFVSDSNPDVIVNCAAMTNVNACETEFSTAMKVNAIGVRNLAKAAECVGAKFIHISTDYVFRGDGNIPYKEWDVCDPQSVYGASKLLGEKYAAEFSTKYFIVRTSWLYGYVGKNFVKTMMDLARKNGSVKVVNDQRGNPTSANDLAHHILKLSVSEEYGIYHCTGSGECSWYDFASKIIEYAKIDAKVLPCTTDEFPSPAKRPSYSSLHNLMLECTVGDEMRDWQTALKQYISTLMEEKI